MSNIVKPSPKQEKAAKLSVVKLGSAVKLTGHNMHGNSADGGGISGYDKKDKSES